MIFILELEIFVSVAVNFHGNIVDSFVSGGIYSHTTVCLSCVMKVCFIAIQRKIMHTCGRK